jgi:hypothetical protein
MKIIRLFIKIDILLNRTILDKKKIDLSIKS